jgi:hypothetical protein
MGLFPAIVVEVSAVFFECCQRCHHPPKTSSSASESSPPDGHPHQDTSTGMPVMRQ